MILQSQLEISASLLANYLIDNDLSISFAESVTGGMLMSTLISKPGISKVLLGGVVCYNEDFKRKLLKVPGYLFHQYSAESGQVSTSIASSINKLTQSNVSVGITGLASEGGSACPTKPVGTVYTCFMINRRFYLDKFIHQGSRNEIRVKASLRCFTMLLTLLKSRNKVKENLFQKHNNYE